MRRWLAVALLLLVGGTNAYAATHLHHAHHHRSHQGKRHHAHHVG